jgi:hypothetical protein
MPSTQFFPAAALSLMSLAISAAMILVACLALSWMDMGIFSNESIIAGLL